MLKETKVRSIFHQHKYCPEDEGELAVAVGKDKDRYHVTLIASHGVCTLSSCIRGTSFAGISATPPPWRVELMCTTRRFSRRPGEG